MTWYLHKLYILYILSFFLSISPCELFPAFVAVVTGVPSFDAFGEQSLQPRKIGNLGIDFGPGGFLVLVRFAFSCLMFIWSSRHPLAGRVYVWTYGLWACIIASARQKSFNYNLPPTPSEMDASIPYTILYALKDLLVSPELLGWSNI